VILHFSWLSQKNNKHEEIDGRDKQNFRSGWPSHQFRHILDSRISFKFHSNSVGPNTQMKSQNNFSSHNIFHINQYHRVLTRQVIKILIHHHITSTIPNIIYSIMITRQVIYSDVLAPGINSCNSQTPIINSITSDLAIHIWCSNIYLCSIC
jgi:hypothetical protein